MTRHGWHIVQLSPWPLCGSIGAFATAMGLINWFHHRGVWLLLSGLVLLVLVSLTWWWDIVIEATFLGRHTSLVYRGLRVGIACFLWSEGAFFFSFFWSYVYYWMVMWQLWPPFNPINPWGIPSLNTALLITSGGFAVLSQRILSSGNREWALVMLAIAILLGVFFIFVQLREFSLTRFCINDTVYGSIFFLLTGFHGLHVIIGTVFLSVNWIRMFRQHFAPSHHFGVTAGNWYWHFVDGVWIGVYLLVYQLGWHQYWKYEMCHTLVVG